MKPACELGIEKVILGRELVNIGRWRQAEARQPLEHGRLMMKMKRLALVPAPVFSVTLFVLFLLFMFFVFFVQAVATSM